MNHTDVITNDEQAKLSNKKYIGHYVHASTLWYNTQFFTHFNLGQEEPDYNVQYKTNYAVTVFKTHMAWHESWTNGTQYLLKRSRNIGGAEV